MYDQLGFDIFKVLVTTEYLLKTFVEHTENIEMEN